MVNSSLLFLAGAVPFALASVVVRFNAETAFTAVTSTPLIQYSVNSSFESLLTTSDLPTPTDSLSFAPTSLTIPFNTTSTLNQSGQSSSSFTLSASESSPLPPATSNSLVSSSANANQSSSSLTSSLPSSSAQTSTSASAVTSSSPSTQTPDPSTLADINTIHVRRLPFIIATASGAADISAWLSTLGSNGKWPDSEIDYTSGCNAQRANWPAEAHWQRIVTMSSAFHGGLKNADQWVNSSDLRAAITLAMDFWFENDFTNIACLDSGGLASCPCGTPGFWNPNWFSNIIGIPELVGQSCLLLNSTLTPTQLSNCTNISGRAYATFGRTINGLGTLTGANTLDEASIGIDLGLLTVNASLIADAFGRVHREVVVQPTLRADGIKPDGSFSQHGGIIYNGNYGKDYTNDVLALEIEAAGTQFEAGTASQDAFESLIDGDQWMIYRNIETGVLHWDFSVLGRFISFPVADNQATGSIKINITEFDVLGEDWDSDALTDAFGNLSINTTDANAGHLNGNRVFYNNDYMVQRGNGYVTTLRMYSNRTQNTECVNSQNPFGFHLSDGTVYTYLSGSEYEDIAAAWDWNLIPGITVDYAATPLSCGQTQFAGIQGYVGGVTTNTVGIGAMRYTNPLTRALSWQKAWFFLSDDVQHVMVNSIHANETANASSSAPIFSVLDQRKHVSHIFVDDVPVSSGNFSGAHTLWHGDVGYAFPTGLQQRDVLCEDTPPVSLTVNVGERTGNWSSLGISTQPPPTIDLFSAWLAHAPTSDSASYTMFPAVTYPQFLWKSQQTKIIEIRNDGNISAVVDPSHKTAMVVFWAEDGGSVTIPSTIQGIAPVIVSSNRGLLVILEETTWTLTVSDPSQIFLDAQVELCLGQGRRPQGWGGGKTVIVPITLPSEGTAGSSVSVPLKF